MARIFRTSQSMVETMEKAPEGAFSIEAYCVCEAHMRTALARIVLHLSAGRRCGRLYALVCGSLSEPQSAAKASARFAATEASLALAAEESNRFEPAA